MATHANEDCAAETHNVGNYKDNHQKRAEASCRKSAAGGQHGPLGKMPQWTQQMLLESVGELRYFRSVSATVKSALSVWAWI